MLQRRNSRIIRIGNVAIGGGNPVSIQSMTNTDTRDVASTLAQIRQLHELGCEIVRLAVPDQEAARALAEIRAASPIPLVRSNGTFRSGSERIPEACGLRCCTNLNLRG